MYDFCAAALPRIDAHLDKELDAAENARVEAHLADCGPCRRELESRRTLKQALSRLSRREVRVRRMPRWPAAAAAVVAALLILVSIPSGVPEVVALTARLHEDVLRGRLTPRDIGLKPSLPGADFVGQCDCPPELGASSPFIVYRRGDVPISLLITEADPGPLPDSARRTIQGRDVYLFRSGATRVALCRSGKLSHIWVSRLDEETLIGTILATPEGRRLLSGETLTLKGISCSACCSLVESRVRALDGIKDASVDIVSMELVVTPEGDRVDLEKVIRAIRQAGYDAILRK